MNHEDILAFNKAVQIANERYDGHFTLLKFTTNYGFCFGTISPLNNETTMFLSKGKTIEEAIEIAIRDNNDCYQIDEQVAKLKVE